MPRPPRNLDEVKRNFEQLLVEPKSANSNRASPVDHETELELSNQSTSAARQLIDTCNAAATAIQKSGEEAVRIASGLSAETDALAELLRKHGNSIAIRIEEFTAMTKRIQATVSAVRTDFSNGTDLVDPPQSPSS
jgi:hypothetical protein